MLTLEQTVKWFEALKSDGVTRDEILDVLEFDSDQYPNENLLKKARDIVFPAQEETNGNND